VHYTAIVEQAYWKKYQWKALWIGLDKAMLWTAKPLPAGLSAALRAQRISQSAGNKPGYGTYLRIGTV